LEDFVILGGLTLSWRAFLRRTTNEEMVKELCVYDHVLPVFSLRYYHFLKQFNEAKFRESFYLSEKIKLKSNFTKDV